jgi:prolyl-tRNA editing enzyme YbaK/EbsC (Cys-tRNA(Pro) deacylase)
MQVTGYRIGTVSPFGIPQQLPILCDARMKTIEEVSLGSGLPGIAIVMRTDELLRRIGAFTWVDL